VAAVRAPMAAGDVGAARSGGFGWAAYAGRASGVERGVKEAGAAWAREAAWVTEVPLIIGALWSTGVVGSGAVAEAAKAPDTVGVVGSDGA
jgi:hypothetical protein